MSFLSATGSFALPNPSANIVVTGLSFQPKIVFFWSMGRTDATNAVGNITYLDRNFGAADGTNQWVCSFTEKNGTTGGNNTGVNQTNLYCIMHEVSAMSGGIDAYATYSLYSMDSGGFTLHPETAGSAPTIGAVEIFYLALGGTQITGTALGDAHLLASTGATSVTGLGITPTCVVCATGGVNSNRSTAYVGGGSTASCLSVGFSDGTNFGTVSRFASGEGSNNQQRHYSQHGECYCAEIVEGQANPRISMYGSINGFVSGGFTINNILASGTGAFNIFYAAIAGLEAHVGNFTTETDTSTHMAQSGFGWKPAAALLLSVCDAEATDGTIQGTGGTAQNEMSIGAFTSTASRQAYGEGVVNPGSPTHDGSAIAYDSVYQNVLSGATSSLQGAMDMVSVDSDGFTTVMTTADPQQNIVFYLAFGGASAPPPATAKPVFLFIR
jgi:hypothetical protein